MILFLDFPSAASREVPLRAYLRCKRAREDESKASVGERGLKGQCKR